MKKLNIVKKGFIDFERDIKWINLKVKMGIELTEKEKNELKKIKKEQ